MLQSVLQMSLAKVTLDCPDAVRPRAASCLFKMDCFSVIYFPLLLLNQFLIFGDVAHLAEAIGRSGDTNAEGFADAFLWTSRSPLAEGPYYWSEKVVSISCE
jgi:hypothetical protein